jgi:hypothetical protein
MDTPRERAEALLAARRPTGTVVAAELDHIGSVTLRAT